MTQLSDMPTRQLVALHDAFAENGRPEIRAGLCNLVRERIQFCGCEEEVTPAQRVTLPTRWRMWLAAVLLLFGVVCAGGGGWWPILCGPLLLFVPALIIDQASREKMGP